MKLRRTSLCIAMGTAACGGTIAQDMRINVTGTNIKRTDTETAAPIETITREDIQASGLQTISDLRRHPDLNVEIAGFADARGPESYNQKLSERRAEVVRKYLEQAGVESARMTARGYGEAHAGAADMSANGLAASRRVELSVKDR